MAANPLLILLLIVGSIVAFILFIIFILVPIFRGIGSLITGIFSALGWLVSHIAEFVGGMLTDIVRLAGSILALLVLALLVPANVIIGRWSAAGHFTDALKRELAVAGGCLYRFCLRRPLKLFWLHGLLEGLEERVPEAMNAAPTSDTPGKRTGQFDGYTIVGSLRGGGSGGKLYVARPDDAKRNNLIGKPDLVVIKSFTLTEGSSLPQIVRESRALECAKQLGHVLEHGMDEHRFYYVMPYHAGDHLGIIARQLHAESDGRGLSRRQLGEVCGYMKDLLATLRVYHEGGFWHKDIKPENIIVHDGRAHVVDLGLITPLKSAMTLTTHGTEYFRDPEMVRQALRGVKVHQVNGVKFDIYAAGAVLYFVLENTFPAHGGLSRFTRQSPEALRWIIKRAMAEYNQRYETAEMMLADLEVVTNADDPFAVKLSALPSMRGRAADAEELDVEIATESPQAAQVAAAGSPIPPKGTPSDWSRGSERYQADRGGPTSDDRPRGRTQPTGLPRRPRLRVVDWFTGKYVVDDPGTAAPDLRAAVGSGDQKSAIPKEQWKHHKKQLKAEVKKFKHEMRAQTDGIRRSAHEQLASARSRVRDMQGRVARRRSTIGVERQPSPAVTVTSILILTAIFLAIWHWPLDNARQLPFISVMIGGTENAVETANTVAAQTLGGLPLLRVIDTTGNADGADFAASAAAVVRSDQYTDLIERYENDGYHVLADVGPDEKELRRLLQGWREQPGSAEVAESLEDILAEHDLYGFLVIRAQTEDDGSIGGVSHTLIKSRAASAKERRWPHVPAEAISDPPANPFLLVNDHPARNDSRVTDRVIHQLRQYEARGWQILIDDDAEVAVRKVLPPGGPASLNSDQPLPQRLQSTLKEHGLAGILLVTAGPGDGPSHNRIALTKLTIE